MNLKRMILRLFVAVVILLLRRGCRIGLGRMVFEVVRMGVRFRLVDPDPFLFLSIAQMVESISSFPFISEA